MSHYRKTFLYALWLWPALLTAAQANLILKNGRIWTADPANPWVEALAVRGNRIMAVGDNLVVAALAAPDARVIDLGGRLAAPGFNDAHIHFLAGSLGLLDADLAGACTVPELQKRIRDFATAHPKEPWITGSGWEYSCFPASRLPAREDLDEAVKDRPAYLRSSDRRTALANSKALQLAGINAHTKLNGAGQIVVDPKTGEPTGILKDGAQTLVRKLIPDPPRERKLAALEQGMKLAASLGVTSIQNPGGDSDTVSLYEELDRLHKLTLRVSVAMGVTPQTPLAAIERFIELKETYRGPHLRAGAVNFTLDGVIEAHTAAMLEPYSDVSGTSGKPLWAQDAYDQMVALCDSGGLQILSHATGDRAVRMALDAYDNSRRVNGTHDARYRIEHVDTIAPVDVPRFARFGVLASMDPIHADPSILDGWAKALGPERMKLACAWQSLEKAGARLVFSSGLPGSLSLDPIRGLHTAVNRAPAQRVSVETAMLAYTANGAYASFEEKQKGTLKQGLLADIVVLSQDVFTIDPAKIHQTKVDTTIFDGQVIFTRQ